MDKKESSSEHFFSKIATVASLFAAGAIVFFAKRKHKSSTQSQSQAQTIEDASPASVTPKSSSTNTPTNTQIDTQSNTQASTQTSTQTSEQTNTQPKINVPPSNTYFRNESHPYSRPTYQPSFSPTKRVTDYDSLLQGTRVMDLPTKSNDDPFGSLNDLRDEWVDDE